MKFLTFARVYVRLIQSLDETCDFATLFPNSTVLYENQQELKFFYYKIKVWPTLVIGLLFS